MPTVISLKHDRGVMLQSGAPCLLGRLVSTCVHVHAAQCWGVTHPYRKGVNLLRLPERKNLLSGSPCRSSLRHWKGFKGVSESKREASIVCASLLLYSPLRIYAASEPTPGSRPKIVSWHPKNSNAPYYAGMRCQVGQQSLLIICLVSLCALKVQGEASTQA